MQGVGLLYHIVKSSEVKLLAPLAIAFPLAILIASVSGRLASRLALLPVVAAPVTVFAVPASDAVKTCIALGLFLLAAAMPASRIRGSRRAGAATLPAVA